MFDDYLVRKEVVLDYKNIDFKQWPYCFFSKGSTHDFGQKMEISSLYVFGQMGLEILFDDHWGRKQALLDYKNLDITKLSYWDFYTGVNQRFWSKIANFLFVCLFVFFFWQNKSRNNVWWSSGEKSNPQPIKCASNFMINKLFFLATNHSACINFCPKPVSESAMQSVSHQVSQPVSQPVSQSQS